MQSTRNKGKMVMFSVLMIPLIVLSIIIVKLRDLFEGEMPTVPAVTGPGEDEVTMEDVERSKKSAPSTPSSLPETTEESHEFDVFLSFRGKDTRKNFTGLLYESLRMQAITPFIDSMHLKKGEGIERLFEYIEKCKVCVPILSKGYADSKWCLKELTKMVACKEKQDVIPVFFDVEPSDIKRQRGPFASAFRKYESSRELKQEEVKKWRKALRKVGKISGHSLIDVEGYAACDSKIPCPIKFTLSRCCFDDFSLLGSVWLEGWGGKGMKRKESK